MVDNNQDEHTIVWSIGYKIYELLIETTNSWIYKAHKIYYTKPECTSSDCAKTWSIKADCAKADCANPENIKTNCAKIGFIKPDRIELDRTEIFVIKIPKSQILIFPIEGQVISLLNHPNIIGYHGLVQYGNKSCLIFDYSSIGDLITYYGNRNFFPEPEARRIFDQLLKGLSYAHDNGFCHRDIKLDNALVFDEGSRFVWADWGYAHYFGDGLMTNDTCGTMEYSSPEVIKGEYYYGPEVDIWSLGVTLYMLVTGIFPFNMKSYGKIL